jgi:methanogenic corrinoid protein MtbC1
VLRLSLLARATAEGQSISEIARLDAPALEALLHPQRARSLAEPADLVGSFVSEALGAAERLDSLALENALRRAVLALGAEPFVDGVVGRLMTEVGERWHAGTISPAHEHLASDTMRRVLAWIGDAYESDRDAPRIVVATPSGEMHELGAMAVAAAAQAEGWRVLYLGPNLPAGDIANAAQQVGAQVVALSVVYANGDSTAREIVETGRAVHGEADVIIGGSAARRIESAAAAAGVRVLAGIDSLRHVLRSVRASRPGTD